MRASSSSAARPFLTFSLVCLVLAGCAAPPTPPQVQNARANRVEAEKCLLGFQQAVSRCDGDAAVRFLYGQMDPEKLGELRQTVRRAMLLPDYEGYRMDIEGAFDKVGVYHWLRGRVRARVRATSKQGAQFSDWFELVRSGDVWLISDLEMPCPRRGDVVRLPAADAARLRDKAAELLTLLKEKHYGEIFYTIPEEKRVKLVQPGFLSRLLGTPPHLISLADKFRVMNEWSWVEYPKVPEPLLFRYVTDKDVSIDLVGRYRPPAGGTPGTPTVVFTLTFFQKAEAWTLNELDIEAPDLPE